MVIDVPPLSKFQNKIFRRKQRHLICFTNRRKGKSFCGKMEVMRACVIPNSEILWCSGTTDDAEKNWRSLCEFLKPYCSVYSPAAGYLQIASSGCQIYRISALSRNGASGLGPVLIVMDEAHTLTQEFFDDTFACISASYGSVVVYANPPGNMTELKECEKWALPIIEHPENYPDWLVCTDPVEPDDLAFMMKASDKRGIFKDKTWDEMLEIGRAEIEAQRRVMNPRAFARNWLAKWVFDEEKRVLFEFHETRNTDEKYGYNPHDGDVYWFLDKGGGGEGKTVCLFAQVLLTRPGIMVFGEHYVEEVIDEDDFLDECIQITDEKNWPMPHMAYHDVRAKGFAKALFRKKIKYQSKNRGVTEGVNRLNSGFKKQWILISNDCKKLIKECNDWKKQQKGDLDKPARNNNDGPDALKYGWEPLLAQFRNKWDKMAPAPPDDSVRPRRPKQTSIVISLF